MNSATTPMMSQWHECKAESPDTLLLFRLGDFYEAFYEDASRMSKDLNLTLTARQSVPMCGIPVHTSEVYIDKLLAKGYKIAVAEQTQASNKGLMKREIVRILTPGTVLSSQLLSDKRHNFFACILEDGSTFGLSWIDLTTGDFHTRTLLTKEALATELCRLQPKELLMNPDFALHHPGFLEELSFSFSFLTTQKIVPSDLVMSHLSRFQQMVENESSVALYSAGAILWYLQTYLHISLDHLSCLQGTSSTQRLQIDRMTMRHLELTESLAERSSKNTLLEILDETKTPMGGRLLHEWLQSPLMCHKTIAIRQSIIHSLIHNYASSKKLEALLEPVRDLERLMIKISSKVASPRDLLALGYSLEPLPQLKKELAAFEEPAIRSFISSIFDSTPLCHKILSAITDSPPIRSTETGIFREGYHPRLDELRKLTKDSVGWMTQYQQKLKEQTGIKTLKVGFTRAFGYYIEVSKAQAQISEHLLAHLYRKQTLTNAERYTSQELKEFEHQILTAEEQSKALESELFIALLNEVAQDHNAIRCTAKVIGELDVLLSLAKVAKEYHWVCPIVDTSDELDIEQGRHPVVERAIGRSQFIANDTSLHPKERMMLITGPNMAGKSTYIRQVGLIVILAQMGSFVPAKKARIGLVDQVFSRIGASDDLSRGHSTFMVEMSETAYILKHATSRSLVLLDEIGRGTSTYDGISIAWAVAEYLLRTQKKQAKTLFATHYWELTALEKESSLVANFRIAVQETPSGIVFLRKILRGGTDKSYGIHVAELAGLPCQVIERAKSMLKQLETNSFSGTQEQQLFLPLTKAPPSKVEITIKALDINNLTPIDALQKLASLQAMLNLP